MQIRRRPQQVAPMTRLLRRHFFETSKPSKRRGRAPRQDANYIPHGRTAVLILLVAKQRCPPVSAEPQRRSQFLGAFALTLRGHENISLAVIRRDSRSYLANQLGCSFGRMTVP